MIKKKILKVEFKEFKELSEVEKIVTKYCNFFELRMVETLFVKTRFGFLNKDSYIFHVFIEYDDKVLDRHSSELLKELKDYK